MLQFQSVPRATLDVLNLLTGQPFIKDFYLVGGTALALYWGHRTSIDIDYFTDRNVNLDQLEGMLSKLPETSMDSKNPIGRIYTIKKVKCDFLNYPYPFLFPPVVQEGITLAHIDDVISLKLGAIANRGAKKDFYDLYFILQNRTIEKLLALYQEKYKVTDVFPLLKSFNYFEDADKEIPPKLLQEKSLSWTQIKKSISEKVKEALN